MKFQYHNIKLLENYFKKAVVQYVRLTNLDVNSKI